MYLPFTDQSRMAMLLADVEARRFHHAYVGTEHVLLGLLREGTGLASKVLLNIGIEPSDLREEVLKIVGPGIDQQVEGMLPNTPRTKTALKYAMEETFNLQMTHVGTIHLLLGLLREKEGVAAQILENFGVDFELLRTRTLGLLAQGLDDTVSKETFDSRIGPKENAIQVPSRQQRMQRPKIAISVIPVCIAHVEGFSIEHTAQLAQRWHGEYVARYGHPWSDDWDEQLAHSLQGENGPALQPGINEKWYPWWKQLLQKLFTDGILETHDCPQKWQIRE